MGHGVYLTPRDLFRGTPTRRLSATDLLNWRTFYDLDPWGERRADLRGASLQDAMLAPYRSKSYEGPKVGPFYPYVKAEVELDEEACWEHLQAMRSAAAARAASESTRTRDQRERRTSRKRS